MLGDRVQNGLARRIRPHVHIRGLARRLAGDLLPHAHRLGARVVLVVRERALREQIDWTDVEVRSSRSPFARAFFTLVEGLGILDRTNGLTPAPA